MQMTANTRLCITPTGPLHIGHAWIAALNKGLSRDTGGTFQLRFETSLVRGWARRPAPPEVLMQESAEDLTTFGLGPDVPMFSDEDMSREVLLLWRLIGGEERYGTYALHQDGQWLAEPIDLADTRELAVSGEPQPTKRAYRGMMTFYQFFSRVAQDFLTGRTWVIRGDDIAVEHVSYAAWATELARLSRERKWVAPTTLYIPRIFQPHPSEDRFVPISSSASPEQSQRYCLRALAEQGVTREQLLRALHIICCPWLPVEAAVDLEELGIGSLLSWAGRLREVHLTPEMWEKALEGERL